MKLIPLLLLLLCSCGQEHQPLNLKNAKAGNLQFFETYRWSEINDSWIAACNWARDHDTLALQGMVHINELNHRDLRIMVQVLYPDNAYGYAQEEDTATIDSILAIPEVKNNFPEDLRFMWSLEPEEMTGSGKKAYVLYAIKVPKGKEARVNGKHIQTVEVKKSEFTMQPTINVTMTDQGSHDWELMTRDNINRFIAITMDNKVLSCPMVNGVIAGGETEISGNFSKKKAEDLAARIYMGRK